MSKYYTVKQFRADFPDDGACLDHLLKVRYGGFEFSCPGCGADSKFSRIKKRRAYACQHCGHHVYPCVGTPFEKSRTPLTEWFFTMYLLTSTRHGVPAKEVERQIGCTYKTAWRMCHELRKFMAVADTHEPLQGHVEIDETLIGGRAKPGADRMDNKTIVMGMVERGGSLRAGPIPDAKQWTLHRTILTNVVRGSTISTDEWKGYYDLDFAGPYTHGTVNHSKKEYVRDIYHVNTLESYWAQLKRSIRGTHIHVSRKHLWKYVAEFSYRFNMRKQPRAMFPRLVASLSLPRLADG